MMGISNNLDDLLVARRLMFYSQRAEMLRKGKRINNTTLKQDMEKDMALISGNNPVKSVYTQKGQQKTEDLQIKLSDLIARLKELSSQPAAALQTGSAQQQIQVSMEQTVEVKASLKYTVLEKVEGLVRRSNNVAETDRYRFDFSDAVTFKITDKWTNRSTTVWGDPHVDVDDMQGEYNGDFKDLTTSDSHTTFMLQDGTRVTFTALDSGVIETVDIFKDNQHLNGIGQASKLWSAENELFSSEVQKNAVEAASIPKGDVVYAGGDGNDWFSADGALLWGKTNGPTVTTRPYAVLQMEYSEKISQQVSMKVNTQA